MADEFANEDFCTGLFDEFLISGLSLSGRDNVIRHLLKLMWYIHNKLPAVRLTSLMKALQPTSLQNENVHILYNSLQERIGVSIQESIANEPISDIDYDSPLKSVPTPGPHC